MEKQEFLKATIEQFSQVYKGNSDCCRCGCEGNYTSTSYANHDRSEVDDALVSYYLEQAKELLLEGTEAEFGTNYVDVPTKDGKTLTFYFDNLKK